MEITGTVISAKTKEPLGEAKITLSVGTTKIASLYSDGKGYFEQHEEAADYIGETLTCAAEKKGFKTKTITRRIEEQIIPLEIAMEEEGVELIPIPKPSILPKILIGAGIGVVVLALVLVGVFVIPKFFGNGEKVEIVSFKAAPSTIKRGNRSILTWQTKNAAEVIIEPLGRRFEPSGSNEVRPNTTTTYTLMARNKEGKEVREVTVEVSRVGIIKKQVDIGSAFDYRNVFEFKIIRSGRIKIEVTWEGAERLALILNGPGQTGYYDRKDGRSPLSIVYEVTPEIYQRGAEWKVSVVNFSRSGRARGDITINYPGR